MDYQQLAAFKGDPYAECHSSAQYEDMPPPPPRHAALVLLCPEPSSRHEKTDNASVAYLLSPAFPCARNK